MHFLLDKSDLCLYNSPLSIETKGKLTMQWFEKLAGWIERRGGKRELFRRGVDGQPSLYMERFYLVKSKYFELMLHRFHMSDAVDVHDHPWTSFGCILKNGYIEHLGDNEKSVRRVAGNISYRNSKIFHRVELAKGTEGNVWTIFGTFKRVSDWGFLVDKTWVPFEKYFKSNGTLDVQTLPEQYHGLIFPTKVITA